MERDSREPDTEGRSFRVGLAMLAVLIAAVVGLQLWGARIRYPRHGAQSADPDQALQGGDFAAKMAIAWPALKMSQRAVDSYKKALPWPSAYRRLGVFKEAVLQQPGLPSLTKIDSPAATRDFDKNDIRKLQREKMMWLRIYGPAKITGDQARRYAKDVKSLNLGPLTDIARAEVYRRAGLDSKAARILAEAKTSARVSLIAAGCVLGLLAVGGIGGFAIAITFLVASAPRLAVAPRSQLSPTALVTAFIVYLASYIGLSAAVELLTDAAGYAIADTWAGAAYMALLVCSAAAAFALGFRSLIERTGQAGQDWRGIGYRSTSVGRDALYGVGGFLSSLPFVAVAAVISLVLSNTVLRQFPTPQQPFGEIISHGGVIEVVLVYFAAVIVAPIVEETFFRGALYTAFRGRMGVWPAVLGSSAIFAVIHPLPGGFLPILALACVLALLRERTGSLLPCMVCHAVYNAVGLLIVTLVF